jgi:LPS-assembly lipoprotein
MRRLLLVLASSALVLSGCGFQLRGQQDYAFKRLYMATTQDPLTSRIKRLVEGGSDTVVVTQAKDAQATLTVSDSAAERTLTTNTSEEIVEYELVDSFSYSLTAADGTVLIPQSSFVLNRSMTYSDNFFLAKANEANLLYDDMRKDAADQIVRRIGMIRDMKTAIPAINHGGALPTPPL